MFKWHKLCLTVSLQCLTWKELPSTKKLTLRPLTPIEVRLVNVSGEKNNIALHVIFKTVHCLLVFLSVQFLFLHIKCMMAKALYSGRLPRSLALGSVTYDHHNLTHPCYFWSFLHLLDPIRSLEADKGVRSASKNGLSTGEKNTSAWTHLHRPPVG